MCSDEVQLNKYSQKIASHSYKVYIQAKVYIQEEIKKFEFEKGNRDRSFL